MPPSTAGQAATANARHQLLTHQIRVADSDLKKAQQRRRWSNIALVLGPGLLVVLFELYWILRGNDRLLTAIYVPGITLSVYCFIVSVKLKLTPGGPPTGPATDGGIRRPRESEPSLELTLARLRDDRKAIAGDTGLGIKTRRAIYRDNAYDDINSLRDESARYRSVNNILQAILIVGSLAATGTSAIVGEFPEVRWVTLGITFTVGMASGFMGYFKYKERSFYLQQTSDAIESEWEALDAGRWPV
jgi:hypothetical protein